MSDISTGTAEPFSREGLFFGKFVTLFRDNDLFRPMAQGSVQKYVLKIIS